jgi:hypothetical protein
MKKFTLLLFITLFLVNIAPAQDTNNNELPWSKITYNQYALSIPSDWWFTTQPLSVADFFIFAPLDTSEFNNNCNMLIQPIEEATTLEQLLKEGEKDVNEQLVDAKIIKNSIVDLGGKKVIEMEYIANLDEVRMHWYQWVWLVGQEQYVFTFTAAINDYDLHINNAKKIFETLRVTK